MKCPNCGTENSDDYNFCISCRASLRGTPNTGNNNADPRMQYPGAGGNPQGNSRADAAQPAGGYGWNMQNQPGGNSSMPGNKAGNQDKAQNGFGSFASGDFVPEGPSGGDGQNAGGFGSFGGQQREFDGLDNPGSSFDSFSNNPSPEGGTFGPSGGTPGFGTAPGGPAFGPAGGEPSFGPPAGDSFFGPGGNNYDSGPMMGDPGFGPPDDGTAFNPGGGKHRGRSKRNGGGNGGGLPKPALVALCILGLLVILFGGALILDHFGVVKVPIIHSLVHGEDKEEKDEPEEEKPGKEPSDKDEPSAQEPSAQEPSAQEPSAQEPSGEEPSKEDPSGEDPSQEKADDKKAAESGQLSVSVTDIAPPELDDYRLVGITGLDAAPGAEGTAPVNMIGGSGDVWRTEVSRISSEDGKKIHLTFPESGITAVEIKAGNWTSKEAYNEDSRPIKIYLTLEGRSYPLSLNDKQVSHYIIFSRPVTSTELMMRIDSCSNDTSGYFAITDIAVYSE